MNYLRFDSRSLIHGHRFDENVEIPFPRISERMDAMCKIMAAILPQILIGFEDSITIEIICPIEREEFEVRIFQTDSFIEFQSIKRVG